MYKSPFLAVQSSFWPFLTSIILFSLISNILLFVNSVEGSSYPLGFRFFLLLRVSFLWWKDLSRERMLGYHTHKLELSLRVGMLLFILSEVFFFLSFFWAFYDSSLSPTLETGLIWPPKGIQPLSVYSVPLLNTFILLTRGVRITWSHHSLTNNIFTKSWFSLVVTILLGVYFLFMQYVEYSEASFSISDGIYGRVFFIATGFHGLHVFIGTVFLIVVLFNLTQGKLVHNHHFSFEAAAWYWHFVDVVWLFLFISVYWWGSL